MGWMIWIGIAFTALSALLVVGWAAARGGETVNSIDIAAPPAVVFGWLEDPAHRKAKPTDAGLPVHLGGVDGNAVEAAHRRG